MLRVRSSVQLLALLRQLSSLLLLVVVRPVDFLPALRVIPITSPIAGSGRSDAVGAVCLDELVLEVLERLDELGRRVESFLFRCAREVPQEGEGRRHLL
jgi:hypothetical protein